jgi:flagellar biosynthesis/type III secretory pathway chaperone
MLPTSQLADLIRRKREVLAQLCDLGDKQKALVERGDTATLLKLLAAKQTLIAALQQIECELAPFHSENPEDRTWSSPNERARCALQAEECNRLLETIVELERHCGERMTARRNEVAAQLQNVHAAGQARDAYQANRLPTQTMRPQSTA